MGIAYCTGLVSHRIRPLYYLPVVDERDLCALISCGSSSDVFLNYIFHITCIYTQGLAAGPTVHWLMRRILALPLAGNRFVGFCPVEVGRS